jgi:D-serine deaminase-like pyridoxal phosphate-dependent protein
MVAAGVLDVLVSNEVMCRRKLARLAACAATPGAQVGLLVDDAGNAADVSAAAVAAGVVLRVLVEVDVGQRRCGVEGVKEAVALAVVVAALPGLKFGGIQAYNGMAQHVRTDEERAAVVASVATQAAAVRDGLLEAGLGCDVITGGGTGTFHLDVAAGVLTEVQPGSYGFGDADYARNERPASGESPLAAAGEPPAGQQQWLWPFVPSLFLCAQVMSRRDGSWAVLDAGLKAQSTESGLPVLAARVGEYGRLSAASKAAGGRYCPLPPGRGDGGPFGTSTEHLTVLSVSDEHSTVAPVSGRAGEAAAALPARGERLLLVPSHCDPFINHYDRLLACRASAEGELLVEVEWSVDARGPGS